MIARVDLSALAETFDGSGTPLIRTDFTDDEAWDRVVDRVRQPTEFDGSPYGPYEPHVTVHDDRAFEGATGDTLAEACAAHGELHGYVVLADARSMREAADGGELTIAYVDLSVRDDEDAEFFESFPGRTFRCAVAAFASTEANLAISNMDFHEYADHVDEDGVFRGFRD
jgi:hypothetical protein